MTTIVNDVPSTRLRRRKLRQGLVPMKLVKKKDSPKIQKTEVFLGGPLLGLRVAVIRYLTPYKYITLCCIVTLT